VEEREALLKVLHAHVQTIAVCEACAATTRDLATEVARGSIPKGDDLRKTMQEAERVLDDLIAVRREVERLILALS
jgi:hypothetical protein